MAVPSSPEPGQNCRISAEGNRAENMSVGGHQNRDKSEVGIILFYRGAFCRICPHQLFTTVYCSEQKPGSGGAESFEPYQSRQNGLFWGSVLSPPPTFAFECAQSRANFLASFHNHAPLLLLFMLKTQNSQFITLHRRQSAFCSLLRSLWCVLSLSGLRCG
uniref:Uncharacterized protein n=1 Tax=Denticeps clupeoides TaxID=299321 RepID=A0AAY4BZD2_9TELE